MRPLTAGVGVVQHFRGALFTDLGGPRDPIPIRFSTRRADDPVAVRKVLRSSTVDNRS